MQGCRQKIFQGGGESQRKKDQKLAKNSTILPLPGGEATKKMPKNRKAENSTFENPGGPRPPCPPLSTPMLTCTVFEFLKRLAQKHKHNYRLDLA